MRTIESRVGQVFMTRRGRYVLIIRSESDHEGMHHHGLSRWKDTAMRDVEYLEMHSPWMDDPDDDRLTRIV